MRVGVNASKLESVPLAFTSGTTRPASIVFVAGPFGPFLRVLAASLKNQSCRVTRLILNGGDLLDWGIRDAAIFKSGPERWGSWVHEQLRRVHATDIVVYNDANPYCAGAIAEARRLNIRVHVLEQGYFRPHWITLEQDGVNGSSLLPRSPGFYRLAGAKLLAAPPKPVGRITPTAVRNLILHHLAMWLMTPIFAGYRAPYAYGVARQCISHIVRFGRQRLQKKRQESELFRRLERAGPIFVALMQRPGDSQLLRHSSVGTTANFIDTVIASFAANAPDDAQLVFKGHPLDHGIEPHAYTIARVAADLGVSDRCLFLDGGHLASLLRTAVGVVTVNSTAGLTAIEFGKPTAVLGQAIYDMPGMTHQSGLDNFWISPQAPDPSLYLCFRKVVMALTQINGAYSTRRNMKMAAEGICRRLFPPAADAIVAQPLLVDQQRTSLSDKAHPLNAVFAE